MNNRDQSNDSDCDYDPKEYLNQMHLILPSQIPSETKPPLPASEVSIIFHLDKEVRRSSHNHTKENPLTYEKLKHLAIGIFPTIEGKAFYFSYRDDENDLVTFSSQEELIEAIKFMLPKSQLLKFTINLEENAASIAIVGTTVYAPAAPLAPYYNDNNINNNNSNNNIIPTWIQLLPFIHRQIESSSEPKMVSFIELKSENSKNINFFNHRTRIMERKWYRDQFNFIQSEIDMKRKKELDGSGEIPVTALVNGLPGIGKSMYLIWFMCEVLKNNSTTSSSRCNKNLRIMYDVKELGRFLIIQNEGVQILEPGSAFAKVDYYFSDNKDFSGGAQYIKTLHLSVSSDGKTFSEAAKRGAEQGGLVIADMPSFSLEEWKELYCTLKDTLNFDSDFADFRYKIFGGNPKFLLEDSIKIDNLTVIDFLENSIQSTLDLFFPNLERDHEEYYHWALNNLFCNITRKSTELGKAEDNSMNIRNVFCSIYKEGNSRPVSQFSSPFLGFLAINLTKFANGMMMVERFNKILEDSGVRNALEYSFHLNILSSSSSSSLKKIFHGNDRDGKLFTLEVGKVSLTGLCTIDDISLIANSPSPSPSPPYGLPCIPNFPVIDSILFQNDIYYCFQVINSQNKHKVIIIEVEKWTEIFNILNSHGFPIYFVWVLLDPEKKDYENFQFNTLLLLHHPTVIQVKISYTENTLPALNKMVRKKNKKRSKVIALVDDDEDEYPQEKKKKRKISSRLSI